MKYNKEQLEAISHKQGPMMVLAGPGSGKTAVITRRVVTLIEDHGVPPEKILVITFSKAAANEMKERFAKLKKRSSQTYRVQFGTFHAVFFRILCHAYGCDASNIISGSVKRKFLQEAIQNAQYNIEEMDDFLEDIEKEISLVKSDGIAIENYYSLHCPEEIFRDIFRYYQSALKSHRCLDFDDMIVYTYELFKKHPQALAKWQTQYEYILIDEFQDINFLQYENIKMLAAPENNLFIVGDDDQSIYGFRGAKPDIMLKFPEEFPSTQSVVLGSNYRSSKQILSSASRLITCNHKRFQKQLISCLGKMEGVRISKCKNMQVESDFIVKRLEQYHEEGISYSDMAVLFRTNMQARMMVGKLMEFNIPFAMKESLPNIFEHFIGKDLMAYFQLAMGQRDRSLFLRIANRPKRYLNRDAFQDAVISFDQLYSYYHEKDWMEERIDKFQQELIQISKLSPYAAINFIRKSVGYDEFLEEYSKFRGMKVEGLLEVIGDIQELARNVDTIEEWLIFVKDYAEKLQKDANQKVGNHTDSVQILTMHASKGLEYQVVFIPDVNEGVTPYRKALLSDDVEEERRMLYVAMTRAKKHLHLTYVTERYNKESEPSRFLFEIAPALKKS